MAMSAAREATSSFQKRVKSKILQIAGCRPSLHNNQLLVSTGVPSLDAVIGGGLAVGTVLLVEEDRFGSYSKLLLKYFISEGVVCSHGLVISTAAADLTSDDLLKDLPAPITYDPGCGEQKSSEDLNIAWRYQNVCQQQASQSVQSFGHYYDLTKPMDVSLVQAADVCRHDVALKPGIKDSVCSINPAYHDLLQTISDKIDVDQYRTSANPETRNILRIAIHSLGSPLWGEDDHVAPGSGSDPSMARFLLALRWLLRGAFCVCMVTVPSHLYQAEFSGRLSRLADTVLRLESFAASDRESNPVFKDYHGLFHVIKLARLNSLLSHVPDTFDLGFKLRRKRFTIEKLHLPPELSDTTSRSEEDPVRKKVTCSTLTANTSLDF